MELADASSGAHSIVAANVFHRAFALGPMHGALPPGRVVGRLIVNGEVRASDAFASDLGEAVRSSQRYSVPWASACEQATG